MNRNNHAHGAPSPEEQRLSMDTANATEAHLATQPQVPTVLRAAVFQAESNCRANGGHVMDLATIDHGRLLVHVEEGLEQGTLCKYLWDCLNRAKGTSIHFAFVSSDGRLCVIYLDRDEGYVALAPIESEGDSVTIGDWEIHEMEKASDGHETQET